MNTTRNAIAEARLSEIIDDGRRHAGSVIERVQSQVPDDSIVQARKLRFDVRDSGAISMFVPDAQTWDLHRNARAQLADRFGVPVKYLDALTAQAGDDAQWRRELAQQILNRHAQNGNGSRFLVRSLGDEARAVLSDKYRRLDSRPLLDAFAGTCKEIGALPVEGHGGELRVSIRAIVPEMYHPAEGEAVVFGLDWSNSDYGKGAYEVSAFVLRLVCINGMVMPSQMKQIHLGGKLPDNLTFSTQTHKLDTETMVSATRDIVRATLSKDAIEKRLGLVKRGIEDDAGGSRKSVEKLLTKAERAKLDDAIGSRDVMRMPQVGAETSRWRMSNALSWVANETDNTDRKIELQGYAGRVLAA